MVSQLQEILEIVCSTKVTSDTPKILELMITEYLTILNDKFPNTMKPKHHFMLHYPSVMRKVGPLWNICCMRFESKNQEGKTISRSALCRVNVCRTIAIRHQLILNYRFLTKSSSYPTYICSSVRSVSIEKFSYISNLSDLLPDDLIDKSISVTNSIEFMGKTIKPNSVIVTFSELGLQFHFADLIILNGESDFLVVAKSLNECYFNEHTRAYKIYDPDSFLWEILSKAHIEKAFISYVNKLSDGKYYISENWI